MWFEVPLFCLIMNCFSVSATQSDLSPANARAALSVKISNIEIMSLSHRDRFYFFFSPFSFLFLTDF